MVKEMVEANLPTSAMTTHHHPEPHHTSAFERQTGPKAFLELFHKNKTHFLNGGGSAKMAPLIAICPHKEGISHKRKLI